MSAFTLRRMSLVLVLCILALGACNMPARDAGVADATQAYETVLARLTEAATLTVQPSPTEETPSPTPQETPTPSLPLPTMATATAAPPTQAGPLCDQAAPGNPIDVTIPDDSRMPPGQAFIKTWRLVNSGSCTWTTEYSIAYFSGEPMGAPASVRLPKNVPPGQSVDVSVEMVAPSAPGTYTSNWKLRNAAGSWFGIGPSGNAPFWVRIIVEGTPGALTPTATSGAGGTPTPAVWLSGSATLQLDDGLDLDSGLVNTGFGDDVGYVLKQNNRLVLVPLNGALFAVFGANRPTFAECAAAPLANSGIRVDTLSPGAHLCYRSDEGLYGWLRLITLDANTAALGVQFLTWSAP